MSRQEVDALVQAVEYADDNESDAPYSGMSLPQINRRYAEWILERLRDLGWQLTRVVA